jgi:PleD family two-component response regulator
VSVSLGVAGGPAARVEQTLRRADEHLYAAKAAGRGRVRW